MNFLRTSGQSHHKNNRDILSHWGWAVPILLVAAALTIRQIDLYPPTLDEFYSMNNAGWLVNGPYSPIDIIQSLQKNSPNHTPGYFMLLSLWGNLTTYDVVLGRVLTIFTGLLSLAMVYRLAKDFVAPVAGLLALIIVASNDFYNLYYAHVRMYPLLVLTSSIVLWYYLRITYQQKRVKRRDYLALGAAVFGLVNTHAFSATFLLMLGIYHLLLAPKNRRWLGVSLAVVAAVLLFSPWIPILIFAGIDRIMENSDDPPVGGLTAIWTWLTVVLNNQPFLLLLSIVGFGLGVWKRKIILKPWLIMFMLFLPVLASFAQFTSLITASKMRYLLAGWLPFILFIVAGLYALYCFRKWLGLLVLFWVIAGLIFQMTADWQRTTRGQSMSYALPPIQVISRLALQAEQKPIIIAYDYSAPLSGSIKYSQREHYFEQHDIAFEATSNPEWLKNYVLNRIITEPSLWVFYQTTTTDAAEIAAIEAITDDLNYQLCETVEAGIDTVILQYAWNTLDCSPPQLLASYQTDTIDYQFYGAELDTANSKLYFNDLWTARTDDALDHYYMSHQLITPDWNNVAQRDLPLVHPGALRLFSIDIADVPAGIYRLMAILYDKSSGERQDWLNNTGDLPDMLMLNEIVIP